MNYQDLIDKQRQFFETNTTKDISFRCKELKRLKSILQANETQLYQAIDQDFKKSEFETYVTELSIIYHEIDLAVSNVKKWARKKRVRTSLPNLPGKNYIIPEPYGSVLIIGAWNYPYQLSLCPAIAAIAAGCTVILKPSEVPARTSAIMAKLINENFDPNFFKVVEGSVEETTALLNIKFDKIFFTGSVAVGKIVYQAAAKHLTPVTLELGGKSPAIITKDANIDMTAKRLVWAKFLNAGQTCIAPDYVLAEGEIYEKLLSSIKTYIEKADYHVANHNYTQIINHKNFDRLSELIDHDKVFYGGDCDKENRTISPTVLKDSSFSDLVMQDEIFGPILPTIPYQTIEEAIQKVKTLSKPLSCYIFTKNKNIKNKILNEISFGGGAINDAVMHFTEHTLPFGGVGNSGIGNYHGKYGFEAFSHLKSVLQKPFLIEPNFKYPPYNEKKLRFLKRIIG
ncbi:aldehyde dehydrogenase [Aquimarina algicola]|uniref:Aldehyde dehydrogenase n=1 Tax=Aquimarina algicola TaxID=2589995 RepID=A0A504J6B6_9FLAO|nr:aldehyde dehydrogenase [Aquimarina algicola]TPN81701.1 aldehyde dehydrogenase [Aquimarina algicola]